MHRLHTHLGQHGAVGRAHRGQQGAAVRQRRHHQPYQRTVQQRPFVLPQRIKQQRRQQQRGQAQRRAQRIVSSVGQRVDESHGPQPGQPAFQRGTAQHRRPAHVSPPM